MVDRTPGYNELPIGTKLWRLHGYILHRTDGPAIELLDGRVSWYLDGIKYPFDEFLELTTCSPEEKCMLKLRYG